MTHVSNCFKQSLQILTCSQDAEGSKCPRQFDNSQEAQDDQVDPTSTINHFLQDDHVNKADHLLVPFEDSLQWGF